MAHQHRRRAAALLIDLQGRFEQRHGNEIETLVEGRRDLRKQHRELLALGHRRIEDPRHQLARAAAAAMRGRGEQGADAEHAANPPVEAHREVIALGARQHVRAVNERHAIEMLLSPRRLELRGPGPAVVGARQPVTPQRMGIVEDLLENKSRSRDDLKRHPPTLVGRLELRRDRS